MELSPFATFVRELERHHGADAALLRHELFFQAGHASRLPPRLRALAALARDAALLCRPAASLPLGRHSAVLVTTLAGASGWGTLARALPSLHAAGHHPVILAHPRLPPDALPGHLPILRPGGVGTAALAAALRIVAAGRAGMVAAARARRALWRAALARCLGNWRGVLVLHNDFDMMSATSLPWGKPSLCLQHGIPTDEFFPAAAERQVVWGDSSRRAYAQAGVPDHALVMDCLSRATACPRPAAAPAGLALVSQTHATIFGPSLADALARLAAELGALAPPLAVLLHPNEGDRHPYGGLAGVAVHRPPHPLLSSGGAAPHLVLAHCSTAALDAALAGHWVAGIRLALGGNRAAHLVADPPLTVASAAEAAALAGRLQTDTSFRDGAALAQQRWLAATFASDGGGLELLLRQRKPA